ncbi:hypothetical protein ACHAXT_002686 [Thalassiosira profunda]
MASPPSSPAKGQAVPVRFLPFRSVAEPSFWLDHNARKLNELRLSEEPVNMRGYFGAAPAGGGRAGGAGGAGNLGGVAAGMRFDSSSSSAAASAGGDSNNIGSGEIPEGTSAEVRRNEWIRSTGHIRSLNTLESFKRLDKNAFLNGACLPRLLACCGVPAMDIDIDTATSEGARGEESEDSDPNEILVAATCLAHCNLKTNVTVYWFAFPALAPRPGCGIAYASQSTPQTRIGEAWGAAACRGLSRTFHRLRVGMERIHREKGRGVWCPPFFLLVPSSDGDAEQMKCLPLSHSSFEGLGEEEKQRVIFGFVDPNAATSSKGDGANAPAAVGWTLRNLVAYASLKLGLGGQNRKFLSYRSPFLRRIAPAEEELDEGVGNDGHGMGMSGSYEDVGEAALGEDDAGVGQSLLLNVRIPLASDYRWPAGDPPTSEDAAAAAALASYRCVGWEANRNGKPGPRSVDLRPLVSPAHLSRQANDLNLRLMKWRALPSLDVEKLGQMKVAILGAGTLGCGVARTLLGWGVRHLTFVDSGKVSYSNPVRQSLFTVDDCKEGGKSKALAAAESLAAIAGPDVEAKGVVLTIPMPGHSFGRGKDGAAEARAVQTDVETLHNLIAESDVAFLLTDTRESRWLPTVMALATNTPLINAALGLDSWLVLRHGPPSSALAAGQERLGCYFCSDVVAPENSTRDRTLDQQCTVTRPGLAPIAASMASELAVAMAHHPMGHCAPAPVARRNEGSGAYAPADDGADPSSSALGRLPHQIRGTVVTYTMMTPTVPAFPSCTACADGVVEAYRREGFDFVRKVCCDGDGSYLEEVSGLAGFREEAAKKLDECLDWDDDDEEEEEEE